MEQERRSLALEIRADEEHPRRVVGYAAVFSSRTDIGGMFTEEIAPGAFRDVLERDVAALFNHDPDHVLGRSLSGTMRMKQDDKGLRYEIDLPESPIGDTVLQAIKRGDVRGSSFSFSVDEADEERKTLDGKRHRIIKRVAELFDLGPVTFPAYKSTSVSARCENWAKEPEVDPAVAHASRRREMEMAELALPAGQG